MATSLVATNGVNLSVTVEGPEDGRPVLLLHGFPDWHNIWRHQVAALTAAGSARSRRTSAATASRTHPRASMLGVWSSGDHALTEAQMMASANHVTGPWRYERIESFGHDVPVAAPGQLNDLLLDFLA